MKADKEILNILYHVAQSEVGANSDSETYKNIVYVILNRVKHHSFPNSVYEVVFSPGQFKVVSNGQYWEWQISDICIAAVNDAYYNYEKSNKAMGALFFKSPASTANWSHLNYLFTDNAQHSFYK